MSAKQVLANVRCAHPDTLKQAAQCHLICSYLT